MQRRASNTGRAHLHQTVTVFASETTLTIELDDGETRVLRRACA